MDLARLLQANGYHGPMPVELCVFGVNAPDLPGSGDNARAGSRGRRNRTEEGTGASPRRSGNQVWVNTRSGKYFFPGSRYYGNTRRGEYMTETEARRRGYTAAQER